MPMFSTVWLQSSFSITSCVVGSSAMRSRERAGARLELRVGHDLEDQADARRLGRGDRVAGEQVALRLLETHAVDPHRGGRRAPDARGRVAEGRALARHDAVGTQHHVGAAADAPALHRGDRRLPRVPELHVGVDEGADHAQIGDGVPDPISLGSASLRAAPPLLRRGAQGRLGPDAAAGRLATAPLPRLRARGPVEPVAGAERGPLGAQQDHAHAAVCVGRVDRGGELVAQLLA